MGNSILDQNREVCRAGRQISGRSENTHGEGTSLLAEPKSLVIGVS